jgi:hypothetical protein
MTDDQYTGGPVRVKITLKGEGRRLLTFFDWYLSLASARRIHAGNPFFVKAELAEQDTD